MKEQKTIQFRLLDSVKQKDNEGNVVEVQNFRHQISARYSTRDENGREVKKVISTGTVWDEKQKKDLPIEVDTLVFIQGYMHCLEGRDQHIIDAMRECVNNIGFKDRYPSDKAIFEEVDADANEKAEVDAQDLIVEAYLALSKAPAKDVIEYAKALNLGVGSLIDKKGVENSKDFKTLITKMKSIAKREPKVFIHNFGNPLRGNLALISDALVHSVITYDYSTLQYSWLQGVNKTPIVQVPHGVTEEKEWFAAWLKENQSTCSELSTRVEGASKMK